MKEETSSVARQARRDRGGLRGFTVLEFLVAATILSLMAVAMFSGFRLALNSFEKSQERLDKKARIRAIEDLVRRQVGSLIPLQPAGFASLQEDPGQVDPNTGLPAGLTQTPLFQGTSESMTFITVAPLHLLQNPGLTVVRYGLAEDEFGRRYFGEMETRFISLESFQLMVDIPRGKPYPVVENVTSLRFQYYGYDAETQSYQWFDEWSGDAMYAVPEAVQILANEQEFLIAINASFYGSVSRGNLLRNLIRQ